MRPSPKVTKVVLQLRRAARMGTSTVVNYSTTITQTSIKFDYINTAVQIILLYSILADELHVSCFLPSSVRKSVRVSHMPRSTCKGLRHMNVFAFQGTRTELFISLGFKLTSQVDRREGVNACAMKTAEFNQNSMTPSFQLPQHYITFNSANIRKVYSLSSTTTYSTNP